MGRRNPARHPSSTNEGAHISRDRNAMGKVNKKGRSKGTGRFVMLTYDMLSSPAWEALSAQARSVLIQIAKSYDGKNNGRIGASNHNLSNQSKVSKNTVTKAIRELVEAGFLEVVQVGAFSLKVRHASEFRLTWQKCDKTGDPQTNAWGRKGAVTVQSNDALAMEPS